ncbi:9941_t:CDS:2, partial [Gigaspora rosea]
IENFKLLKQNETVTILGPHLIVNTLIISHIWYMATLLPPSSKQQSYSTFGLQAPVLLDILIACKIEAIVKAWKKVEGMIGKNKESWFWVLESLLVHEQDSTYSIKK